MDGETLSVAQKGQDPRYPILYDAKTIREGKEILRKQREDDPNGNLGMTIHMDGEVYNIAQ